MIESCHTEGPTNFRLQSQEKTNQVPTYLSQGMYILFYIYFYKMTKEIVTRLALSQSNMDIVSQVKLL